MKRKGRIALLGMFVIASFATTLVLAADKEKKPEDKPAAKEPMFMAACPDPCAFSVHSHDKNEVVAVLKEHAKSHHNMALSDKDAEAMVKAATPKK